MDNQFKAGEHIRSSRAGLTSIAIQIVFASLVMFGCDPVSTVGQKISIKIEDNKGAPVLNATVSLKESWESWSSEGVRESEMESYRKRWESDFVPWLTGVTNKEGIVNVMFVETAMQTNSLEERDRVFGKEYIIVVDHEQVRCELLSIMRNGNIVRNMSYTVTILEVSPPREVQ